MSWNKRIGKWRAAIYHEGRQNHIGLFNDEEEAARARFLTYDVGWGEQFNFRKATLRAALAIVRVLHAEDPSWVLVLPPLIVVATAVAGRGV